MDDACNRIIPRPAAGSRLLPGGHGIGKMFHTNPNILHYKNNESNGIMKEGHTFTIEPMICEGTGETMKSTDCSEQRIKTTCSSSPCHTGSALTYELVSQETEHHL